MGKPKTQNLPFESTTQYTEFIPGNTPDLQAVRDMDVQPPTLAPDLQAQYDQARRRAKNRFNSAYDQNIPNAARMAMQEDADREISRDYGTAQRSAAYDSYDRDMQRKLALAGLTIGRPLQQRISGTNSQVVGGTGVLNSVIGGGATVAAAF
jgi:hypothetical protein